MRTNLEEEIKEVSLGIIIITVIILCLVITVDLSKLLPFDITPLIFLYFLAVFLGVISSIIIPEPYGRN